MRRTLIGAVATAALVATSLPAAGAAVPVDGSGFTSSGLTPVEHGCADTRARPVDPAKVLIERGPKNPPIGHYSSGWATVDGSFGAGITAAVPDPSTLNTFRIKVYSPGSDTLGVVVATYHAPNDDGTWKGLATLPEDTTKGWHTVSGLKAVFTWNHFAGDTSLPPDRSDPNGNLAEMVARHGGDGSGADLGFLFGCNTEKFYVDALELETGDAHDVYDFGGFRTTTALGIGAREKGTATVTAGRSTYLRNLLYRRYGGAALSGKIVFESRPASGGKWSRLDARKVGTEGTKVGVTPHLSSLYRARFLGSATNEPSTSRTVKVLVQKKVSANFVDGTVTKGHTATVSGHVQPAKAGAVKLQRYLKGKWRTVKKGHSDGRGHFGLSFTSTSLGKSYWRVLAPSGGGSVAGHSGNLRLTTNAPPAPPSGGGGGDNPPPTDPPDDPPPPTGPHRGAW